MEQAEQRTGWKLSPAEWRERLADARLHLASDRVLVEEARLDVLARRKEAR